jgi:hypothetical protein
MTFVRQIDCQSAGLPWVNMYNKAGYPVVPSMYSVQAAMIEFSAAYNAGNLTLDIVDAPGNESWPLAYMTFILLNQSITSNDCTNIQELLRCPHCPITPPPFGTTLIFGNNRWLAWTQTNDAYLCPYIPPSPSLAPISPQLKVVDVDASSLIAQQLTNQLTRASSLATESYGLVPIDVSLRKNLLNLFTSIRCNNATAINTAYVIGAGPPLPIFTAWAADQSTSQVVIKYYEDTTEIASTMLYDFDEEFGTSMTGLAAQWYTSIPDIVLAPAAVFGMVPSTSLAVILSSFLGPVD